MSLASEGTSKLGAAEAEVEVEVEHNLARYGITKMMALVDEPGFGAAVEILAAGIKHHVREEETEVFFRLEKQLTRDELTDLGDAVGATKAGTA